MLAEGVDDSQPPVVLLVVHVLGVDRLTPNDTCCREYRGVPVGYAEAVAEVRRPPEDIACDRLRGHFRQPVYEPYGPIVAQPVEPGPPGGLVVEFLQDLDREGQRVLSQDLDSPGALAGIRRVGAVSVEEDVGVSEARPAGTSPLWSG